MQLLLSRAHAQTKIELACRRELQKMLKCLTDSKSPPLGRRFDDFVNFLPYVTKGGIDFFEKKKKNAQFACVTRISLSIRLRDTNLLTQTL